jgi:hypothetical protein
MNQKKGRIVFGSNIIIDNSGMNYQQRNRD